MWFAIMWTIWMHRNRIIFKSMVKDGEEVFNLAQVKPSIWIEKALNAIFSYSNW